MKLFKKVLSTAAVLALVVTAVPRTASAATDVIDFEDGNMPGLAVNTGADGAVDGDNFLMTVEDFNGSKALFIDVQDAAQVPKLAIKVPELVGADNVDKVRTVEFDLTIVNPSGEAAGWNGGSFGANIGADGSKWYDPADWVIEEYDKAQTATQKMSDTFVATMGFTKGVEASKYLFMKWASANDMYIDNIRFLDADGNAIPLVAGGAAVEETATEEKADDAAADTTTAEATAVPKTGTASYALLFAAGAAAMLAGAVVLKKRNFVEE